MAATDVVPVTSSVSERLRAIEDRMQAALRRAGRAENAARLVAVSKFQTGAALEAALAVGQRAFGESRVQEAGQKWSDRKERQPEIELHLVGRLQSNKVRAAVRLFEVIQTVDSVELARALGSEMKRTERRPRCLIQVNTGRETQKAGVFPEAADRLIEECVTEHDLPLTGVMCIPPEHADPRPHFELLGAIARRNGLAVLSMGMSRDFECAIAHGATHVRIGSAIFGERHP
jgi:pyridoxal phosphate enzyme (YggS family)